MSPRAGRALQKPSSGRPRTQVSTPAKRRSSSPVQNRVRELRISLVRSGFYIRGEAMHIPKTYSTPVLLLTAVTRKEIDRVRLHIADRQVYALVCLQKPGTSLSSSSTLFMHFWGTSQKAANDVSATERGRHRRGKGPRKVIHCRDEETRQVAMQRTL